MRPSENERKRYNGLMIHEDEETKKKLQHTVGLFHDYVSSLMKKLKPMPDPPKSIDFAFHLMQERMIQGMNTLNMMEKHSKHDHYHDALAVLRVMYDLHLQFLYILTDPVKLSVQYCNHANVEVFRHLEIYYKYPTKFANQLKQILNWDQIRKKIEADYNRVKADFLNSKGKPRINW
jgi:hypothetical protein